MSAKGIKLAASAFSNLQDIRHQLLEMGSVSGKMHLKEYKQDILLAQMLDDMKEAGKEKFCKITS